MINAIFVLIQLRAASHKRKWDSIDKQSETEPKLYGDTNNNEVKNRETQTDFNRTKVN